MCLAVYTKLYNYSALRPQKGEEGFRNYEEKRLSIVGHAYLERRRNMQYKIIAPVLKLFILYRSLLSF